MTIKINVFAIINSKKKKNEHIITTNNLHAFMGEDSQPCNEMNCITIFIIKLPFYCDF